MASKRGFGYKKYILIRKLYNTVDYEGKKKLNIPFICVNRRKINTISLWKINSDYIFCNREIVSFFL